ncbi:MAG: GNAT family N-acetyltransferase [Candidatus Eisenbacteria bacterium]|nr:GNAT family N-acetyltransferase [Candidatus Eisenbacteria bacterium]
MRAPEAEVDPRPHPPHTRRPACTLRSDPTQDRTHIEEQEVPLLEHDAPPLERELPGDYHLRCARDADDLERVGDLCEAVFAGEDVRGLLVPLFTHHPHTRLGDLLLVTERHSRQVVASLSLIPWTLELGGVPVPAAEMGIVATAAAHRGRGLQQALVEQFRERMRQRGCLLSHIQGIPHFYRRYGYEHALPLEGGLRLALPQALQPSHPPAHLAHPLAGTSAAGFRLACQADWPAIARLHRETARALAMRSVRDPETWDYLRERTPHSDMRCEDWLLTGADDEAAGYFRLPAQHFGDELTVNEASHLDFEQARATLAHLAHLADERGKPGLRLNLHRTSTLMRLARDLGAEDLGDYGWQIHVPDFAALLERLAPLLERRVADSPFAGLTREVRIDTYRRTIALDFRDGRVLAARDLGATEDLAIRIPANHLTQLLFGWRSREQLAREQPELQVAPTEKMLVDTLLPKVEGFLYTIY